MARRTAMLRLAATGLGAALWVAGCNYFDSAAEGLIPKDDDHEKTDGGGDKPDSGGPAEGAPADKTCGVDVPTLPFADKLYKTVPTAGLKNNVSEPNCLGDRSLTETDGFYRLELTQGERYHFHVQLPADQTAPEGQDLALYLLTSSCDDRGCAGAVDECPGGFPEHFSFVPDQSKTYYLGIDGISKDPTDVPVEILAVHVNCGTGQADQHGKACDDGNLDEDKCDSQCRVVLGDGSAEAEPNDDQYLSNVVKFGKGQTAATLTGGIAGAKCNPDYFLVHVQDGQTLDVKLLNSLGDECQAGEAPPTQFTVSYNRAGVTREATFKESSATPADGTCPVIHEENLDAGDYYIALRARGAVPEFKYSIRFELTKP